MITTDLVWFEFPGGKGTLNPDWTPMRRSLAEAHLARYPNEVRTYGRLVEAPTCICCGSLAVSIEWADGWRCPRHAESTPCRVEGCKRTGRRAKYSETICAEHWRAGVPVGSAARKVWNRFHRIVKRYGWTPEREARSDRLWAWLKARCQAAARGDLDQREIDALFGWD